MKTIILNGSPKGNSNQCNSLYYAKAFNSQMKNPCEIKHIAKEDPEELAAYIQSFDSIIMIFPLYIHGMPGIVMKFIEKMSSVNNDDKYLGFIVQAGFIETAQHNYLNAYLRSLTENLNYNFLGILSKGESAGVYMVPKMYKKVLKRVGDFGRIYEIEKSFDKTIIQELGEPYEISSFKLKLLKFMSKIGIDNIMWHRMLKKNHAFEKRLDQPFKKQ